MDPAGRTSTEVLNGNSHSHTHPHTLDTTNTTADNTISSKNDALSQLPPVPASTTTDAPLHDATHEKAHPVLPAVSQAVDNVMYSDIGISTLLSRLKQSIASARELAAFFKGLSKAEDQKANSLRNLVKSTLRERHESRAGSYAQYFEQVASMQDRVANNGVQLSLNLTQMHDDLLNMVADKDRERKHWKSTGLSAEERTLDAERAMEKAKSKYDSLAEDYDAARTGDKSGRHFGIRSIGKSNQQQEEDLQRRVRTADEDYQAKVQAAQASRSELHSSGRPQAVRALQQLIDEVDNAVVMQLQKYAGYSEQTVLRDGLLLAPGNDVPGQKGLRDIIGQIDNEQDFRTHILSFSNQVPPKKPDIKYEQHPTLIPRAQPVVAPTPVGNASMANRSQTPAGMHTTPMGTSTFAGPNHSTMGQAPPYGAHQTSPSMHQQQQQFPQRSQSPSLPPQDFGRFQVGFGGTPQATPGTERYGNQGPPYPDTRMQQGPYNGTSPTQHMSPTFQNRQQPDPTMYNYGPGNGSTSFGPVGPPHTGPAGAPHAGSMGSPHAGGYNSPVGSMRGPGVPGMAGMAGAGGVGMMSGPGSTAPGSMGVSGPRPSTRDGLPSHNRHPSPSRRTFGISLDDLFTRDKTPVPLLVIQCIQAVDHFGLSSEGIYRVSGNQNHIQQLKSQFDTDASRIDFRNPEAFFHDVHVPANLLKLFFRELPDSLFTRSRYEDFIRAAQIDDDAQRRDNLHAIINDLPDANYATLRALVLHLHRVDQHSDQNRMTPTNLAVIFGPTLMGPHTGADMALGALQPKVIGTILQNALQIFDED